MNGTPDKKQAEVTVTATVAPAPKWVSFAMTANYPNKGGNQDGDKLKFNKGSGAFDITFTLDDDSGLGLAFYPDFADAMWVAVGDKCPKGPGNGNGTISAVCVDAQTLTVSNANGCPLTLTFALRFTGVPKDDFPPYVYDPKIINSGGSNLDDDDQGEDED